MYRQGTLTEKKKALRPVDVCRSYTPLLEFRIDTKGLSTNFEVCLILFPLNAVGVFRVFFFKMLQCGFKSIKKSLI